MFLLSKFPLSLLRKKDFFFFLLFSLTCLHFLKAVNGKNILRIFCNDIHIIILIIYPHPRVPPLALPQPLQFNCFPRHALYFQAQPPRRYDVAFVTKVGKKDQLLAQVESQISSNGKTIKNLFSDCNLVINNMPT